MRDKNVHRNTSRALQVKKRAGSGKYEFIEKMGGGSILSYRSFLILFLVFPSSLWAQDTTPPTVSSATVDETTLVVNFNEGLASVSGLTNSAFTVEKTSSGGSEEDQTLIGTPTVRGETVPPTLSSAVIAPDMETVKLIYTAPTESGAKLRDAEGSDVVDSMDLKVLNICSRSEVVRDAILAQITETVSCGEVTSNDLKTITVLDLSQRGITELKSDDFNGLTGLDTLSLNNNDLTDLHRNLFDGLESLEQLNLNDNALTDLPRGLLDGLTNLVTLRLNNNALTDLPRGLFDGLPNLREIFLSNNALTDLDPDLFDGLTGLHRLSLSNNSLTPDPDLFDGLTSLWLLHLGNNALTDLPRDLFDGLTNLRWLILSQNSLTDLDPDLFDGLTSLIRIYLEENSLTSLHENLFDGLTNLRELYLKKNALTDLDPDLFDGLNLRELYLHENALTSLHEDLFNGLTSLERLWLHENALTDLPQDLFDGLTSLEWLRLEFNAFTDLHEDLFDGLTSLGFIDLDFNALTDLPPDLFDGLTSLESLTLQKNALTDLPPDLFDGLTSLSTLRLGINSLTSLHEDLFDGLTNLSDLNLHTNNLTGLHPDLFDGLTSLDELYLSGNALTDLHPDLFDGLTSLDELELSYNNLTSLHQDLFDGLTNLEWLRLEWNALTGLHPDLFDDVEANPFNVSVEGNPLTCVPDEILNQQNVIIIPSSLRVTCPAPSVTLSTNPDTIGEEDEATEVTVTGTLNVYQATDTPVTVSVGPGTATAGTDFSVVSDFVISIPANTLSATGMFTLAPTSDTVDEPDETVMITGTSTVENVTVIGTRLTITDDEDVPAVTLVLDPSTIDENGGKTTVTATLNRPSSAVTTIAVTVLPDAPAMESDYQLSDNQMLIIAAGETESTGLITITAVDNEVDAPDKAVQVQGRSTNAQGVTDPEDVTLTIIDDDTSTAAEAPTELPTVFTLYGNYPNPFNPSTRIQFDLPERAQVTVQILDVLGRKVMEYPAQAFDAGANQTIELNAIQLGSGTYLYRMIAVGSETKYQETGRMILMK